MKRLTIWLAVIAACSCTAPVRGASRAGSAMLPKHRVGFHVFDKWNYLPDDGSGRPSATSAKPAGAAGEKPGDATPAKPLVTAVWYPASRTRKRPFHEYAKGVTGLAVRGALLLPGDKNRPLIVFSHDFGGSAISAVYLVEYLAGCGYIVAAADHNDSACHMRIAGPGGSDAKTVLRQRSYIFRKGTKLNREPYSYRLVEIKTVIDKMIAESEDPKSFFANMIDPERIGVLAHGLGGWAAMSMMGMPARHPDRRPVPPAGPDGADEPVSGFLGETA